MLCTINTFMWRLIKTTQEIELIWPHEIPSIFRQSCLLMSRFFSSRNVLLREGWHWSFILCKTKAYFLDHSEQTCPLAFWVGLLFPLEEAPKLSQLDSPSECTRTWLCPFKLCHPWWDWMRSYKWLPSQGWARTTRRVRGVGLLALDPHICANIMSDYFKGASPRTQTWICRPLLSLRVLRASCWEPQCGELHHLRL